MATVLIVDDDPGFVRTTAKVLEKAGHRVLSAGNGTQALKMMRQTPPDLVMLDIMLSYVLDGLDVSREMAEDPLLKDIPVIMMTCLTTAEGSAIFPTDEHIPVDEWLCKPADPQTLLSRLNKFLA